MIGLWNDVELDNSKTLRGPANTLHPTTGVLTAPSSGPTATAYKEDDYESQSDGISLTVTAVSGKTGMYSVSKSVTTAGGFSLGDWIVIVEHTTGSVAQKDCYSFRVI